MVPSSRCQSAVLCGTDIDRRVTIVDVERDGQSRHYLRDARPSGGTRHRLHGLPISAIAVSDLRLGSVVIASLIPDFNEADVIDMEAPGTPEDRRP